MKLKAVPEIDCEVDLQLTPSTVEVDPMFPVECQV